MIESKGYAIQIENWAVTFEVIRGSPVIISVPHDGLLSSSLSGFFTERRIGHRVRDRSVWPVAKDVLTSALAHAVYGLMPRALIDYNRAWPEGINYYPLTQKETHTALDDARLVKPYHHYHRTIDRLVSASIQKFGGNRVLLLDLHGFKNQPAYAPEGGFDLILGTGNRTSIHHGEVDVALAQFMTNRGYRVFLPQDTAVGPVEDSYSADYTTRHHSEKHAVNAIQIEIAARFREQNAYAMGRKLSNDLAEFISSYCAE